ncbi:MAG: peptidase M14, partial [Aliifodinibius sp.]|nr:peptidase M14 [Fodinibius sp.]
VDASYQIIIDDMSAYYKENIHIYEEEQRILEREMRNAYNIRGFEFGSMGGYYTYSEVVTELDSMRLIYPNLVSAKQSIGLSLEGRDIWMAKISDNPDVDE